MISQSILSAEQDTFTDEHQSLLYEREQLHVRKQALSKKQADLLERMNQQALDESRVLNVSKVLYEEQLEKINIEYKNIETSRRDIDHRRQQIAESEEELDALSISITKIHEKIAQNVEINNATKSLLESQYKEMDALRDKSILAQCPPQAIDQHELDVMTHEITSTKTIIADQIEISKEREILLESQYNNLEKLKTELKSPNSTDKSTLKNLQRESLEIARKIKSSRGELVNWQKMGKCIIPYERSIIPVISKNVFYGLTESNLQAVVTAYANLIPAIDKDLTDRSPGEIYQSIKRMVNRHNTSQLVPIM